MNYSKSYLPDSSNFQPFFTIIIATLNVEETVEECLESIIQQTELNKIEILIKDGGSTDKTIDRISKYTKHISYFESSPDSGVYDAWNKLLPLASGKWILFLGADDKLFDQYVIASSLTILNENKPSIELAYGRVRLINKNNETIIDIGKDLNKTKKCIKEKMCVPHQGVFHKRSLFIQSGYFNTDYIISSDYDFIRRVLLDTNLQYLDMIVACMRTGGISSDPKNTFLRLKEVRIINRKLGRIIPGPLWLITYTNACFRSSLFFIFGEKSGNFILDRLRMIAGLPSFWTKI